MRAALAIALTLLLSGPAAAHSLRVFAKVEDGTVRGYGFFIGGGRPRGVPWTATVAGTVFASGRTDDTGGFAFAAPRPVSDAIIVVIDTGEGHVASARLPAARFGSAAAARPPEASTAREPAPTAHKAAPAAPTAREIAALVEAAVARQVGPLLERIEAMDARLRFTDIVAGLCLIFGLAGIGLWAHGRRA
ncbi:MAG: hypothetical protein AcusKO_44050 [Acuticoccus sp.]